MIDNDAMHVSFSCVSRPDGDWKFSKPYPDGTPWDEILSDFARWLGAVYGYDLTEKITTKNMLDNELPF